MAIQAREQGLDVTVVDKGCADRSSANIMTSGFWTVFSAEWGQDIDASINEVNKSGEYLNNREWSEIVLKESWATYEDLVSWDVKFPVEVDKTRACLDIMFNIDLRYPKLQDVLTAHLPLLYRGAARLK
ncbi:MAG: FAD-binding protein [Syntrophorhabdales bacterium]